MPIGPCAGWCDRSDFIEHYGILVRSTGEPRNRGRIGDYKDKYRVCSNCEKIFSKNFPPNYRCPCCHITMRIRPHGNRPRKNFSLLLNRY